MMYVKNLLVFTVCFSLAFPAWAGESFFQKIFIDPMVDMVTSSTEQEKLQDELDKTNEQIKETQEEIVKTEKALKKESSRKKKDAEEIEELESTLLSLKENQNYYDAQVIELKRKMTALTQKTELSELGGDETRNGISETGDCGSLGGVQNPLGSAEQIANIEKQMTKDLIICDDLSESVRGSDKKLNSTGSELGSYFLTCGAKYTDGTPFCQQKVFTKLEDRKDILLKILKEKLAKEYKEKLERKVQDLLALELQQASIWSELGFTNAEKSASCSGSITQGYSDLCATKAGKVGKIPGYMIPKEARGSDKDFTSYIGPLGQKMNITSEKAPCLSPADIARGSASLEILQKGLLCSDEQKLFRSTGKTGLLGSITGQAPSESSLGGELFDLFSPFVPAEEATERSQKYWAKLQEDVPLFSYLSPDNNQGDSDAFYALYSALCTESVAGANYESLNCGDAPDYTKCLVNKSLTRVKETLVQDCRRTGQMMAALYCPEKETNDLITAPGLWDSNEMSEMIFDILNTPGEERDEFLKILPEGEQSINDFVDAVPCLVAGEKMQEGKEQDINKFLVFHSDSGTNLDLKKIKENAAKPSAFDVDDPTSLISIAHVATRKECPQEPSKRKAFATGAALVHIHNNFSLIGGNCKEAPIICNKNSPNIPVIHSVNEIGNYNGDEWDLDEELDLGNSVVPVKRVIAPEVTVTATATEIAPKTDNQTVASTNIASTDADAAGNSYYDPNAYDPSAYNASYNQRYQKTKEDLDVAQAEQKENIKAVSASTGISSDDLTQSKLDQLLSKIQDKEDDEKTKDDEKTEELLSQIKEQQKMIDSLSGKLTKLEEEKGKPAAGDISLGNAKDAATKDSETSGAALSVSSSSAQDGDEKAAPIASPTISAKDAYSDNSAFKDKAREAREENYTEALRDNQKKGAAASSGAESGAAGTAASMAAAAELGAQKAFATSNVDIYLTASDFSNPEVLKSKIDKAPGHLGKMVVMTQEQGKNVYKLISYKVAEDGSIEILTEDQTVVEDIKSISQVKTKVKEAAKVEEDKKSTDKERSVFYERMLEAGGGL